MKNEIGNKKDAKLKLRKHLKGLAIKKKPYVFTQANNKQASPADKRNG